MREEGRLPACATCAPGWGRHFLEGPGYLFLEVPSLMWLARLASALGLVPLVVGCDFETLSIQVCTGTVAIAASSEPSETFSWQGGCGVGEVVVREAQPGGQIVWHIQDADGTNRLTSPLAYGRVPPGIREVVAAVPLRTGTEYLTEVQTLRLLHGRTVTSRVGGVAFVR